MANGEQRAVAGGLLLQPGDIAVLLDRLGRILEWNEEAEKAFGFARADVLMMPFSVVCPQRAGAPFHLRTVLAGRDFAGGYGSRRRDGAELELYLYATATKDPASELAVACVAREVGRFWRAQEVIRTSEERYRLLLEQSLDAVVVADSRGRIADANPAACRMFGYEPEELTRLNLIDLLVPARAPGAAAEALDILRRDGALTDVFILQTQAGQHLAVEVRAVLAGSGGQEQILAIGRDVTERLAAERAVRASEEKYRAMFEGANDTVLLETLEGRILDANANASRLLRYTREELLDLRVEDLVPDEVRALLPAVRDAILKTGSFRGEALYRRKDGTLVPVSVSASRIDLAGDTLVMVILRDISERRRAEQRLRESEEQYRTAMDAMAASAHVVDQDLRILLVNRACEEWCRRLGLPGPLLGRRLPEVFPFLPERVWEEYAQVLSHGRPLETAEVTELAGTAIHTETRKTPVLEGGRVVRVLTVIRDVTERRQAEQAARESAAAYRSLFELSPDGIAVHQDGRIVMINSRGAQLLGYDSPAELIGQPVIDIVHPNDRQLAAARIRAALEEGRRGELIEERFRRRDGTYVPVEVANAPFVWAGRPAVQVVVRDISERKRLRAEADAAAAYVQGILSISPQAIAAEVDGRIAYANQQFARLYGYELGEVVGMRVAGLIAPEDQGRIVAYSAIRRAGGTAPDEYEFNGLRKDGTVVRLRIRVATFLAQEKLHTVGFIERADAG